MRMLRSSWTLQGGERRGTPYNSPPQRNASCSVLGQAGRAEGRVRKAIASWGPFLAIATRPTGSQPHGARQTLSTRLGTNGEGLQPPSLAGQWRRGPGMLASVRFSRAGPPTEPGLQAGAEGPPGLRRRQAQPWARWAGHAGEGAPSLEIFKGHAGLPTPPPPSSWKPCKASGAGRPASPSQSAIVWDDRERNPSPAPSPGRREALS